MLGDMISTLVLIAFGPNPHTYYLSENDAFQVYVLCTCTLYVIFWFVSLESWSIFY